MGVVACCVETPTRDRDFFKQTPFDNTSYNERSFASLHDIRCISSGQEFQGLRPYNVPSDVILIRSQHFSSDFQTVRNLPSLEANVTSYELECITTQNRYLCRSIDYNNDRVFQNAYNEVQLLKRLS